MAYRAHIVVLSRETGKALSVPAIKGNRLDQHWSQISGRVSILGSPGTRYGTPGIWVEVEPRFHPGNAKPDFVNRVRAVIFSLTNRGYDARVYTTNAQSQQALLSAVPTAQRG